ncbi:MAG TPA: isoprenylcysteine carboxylmethyltransferase family protein [Candidatus Binataceae bacterium]|nr:isoprenylcysteine carboxylmethyltransferase family protein [Candidatus Binataceae bacterium]
MTSLGRQGLLRTIPFIGFIALIIFVPAGTIHFWQGWLFLIVFTGAIAAISVYLLRTDPALFERRMNAGPRAESRPLEKVIQAITGGSLMVAIVIAGLDHRFGWSEAPGWVAIAANVVIVVSFGAVLVVLRENTFAASTIGIQSGQRVIDTGMYSLVRHPMYATALPGIIAAPLALGSYWAVLATIPLIAGLMARILDEERLLANELPGYEQYRRTVRWRLLPRVW